MLQRGVVVSYETIRQWCARSGQVDANRLRRRRARPGDKWHLDEVVIEDQRHDPLPVARGRPARQCARRPGAVTPKRVGCQEVRPPTAQGTAVRGAGAGHRQARQLRAGPPRGDALGGTPAIEVSEQSGRKRASASSAISMRGNMTSHGRTLRNRRESQRFSAGYVGSELCLARKGSRIDRETLWDRSRTATAVRCRPPKSGIQPLDAGVAASWPYRATRMTSRRTQVLLYSCPRLTGALRCWGRGSQTVRRNPKWSISLTTVPTTNG